MSCLQFVARWQIIYHPFCVALVFTTVQRLSSPSSRHNSRSIPPFSHFWKATFKWRRIVRYLPDNNNSLLYFAFCKKRERIFIIAIVLCRLEHPLPPRQYRGKKNKLHLCSNSLNFLNNIVAVAGFATAGMGFSMNQMKMGQSVGNTSSTLNGSTFNGKRWKEGRRLSRASFWIVYVFN